MSGFSDYVFIKDGEFTVPANFTFTAPSIATGRRAILSFRVKSTGGEEEDNLGLAVFINDRNTPVHSQTLKGHRTYDSTIQEALENHVLEQGNNVIRFQKSNPVIVQGPIRLSDVVVWYGADTFLALNSTDGKQRIRFDANIADMRMGGNGQGADLVLFPASGNIGSLSQATFRVRADTGDLIMGGNGTSGDVELKSANGTATIRLIAATGEVSATTFIAGGIPLNVPDYVWDSNYVPMPLAELRAYTAREKRLPGMPSAAEITRKGLNLSQFQMQLLEKIEELTRYLFAQQETIQAQEARLDALDSQLKQLAQGQP